MPVPAAKHFDPILGIDTHIVLIPTPAGPVPTPLPHPYVGMLLDPMDYVPYVGGTIKVNGLMRAVAGTSGQALPPHIPMGGPFAKPPTNESEMFMGSMTVNADGDPMSFAMLPVLSCQDVGIPAPFRKKKNSPAKSLMLPTSIVLPIPAGPPVLVGGAPTIATPGAEVLIGPLCKGLVKARKALARKSKKFARGMRALSDRLHKLVGAVAKTLKLKPDSALRNKVHRRICAVTGHPVDIASGKMFTDFTDLTLRGPLPFALERVWFSTSTYEGPLGYGWHASFDLGLAVSDEVIGIRLADGRLALFPPLEFGREHHDSAQKLTLSRDAQGYALREGASGLTYRFAGLRQRADQPVASISDRNGFTIRFGHDERGNLTRIVDSSGRSWELSYDGQSRVHAIYGPHPTEPTQRVVVMQYSYDERGNLIEARDALGQSQRFLYQRHLLVKETNKNGLSFYFQYDGLDDAARCVRTWGDGGIYDHKLTYDLDRNLTAVENSLGHKTAYFHDGAMVHKTIDAFGNITETEYDEGYRPLVETDALGQRTVYSYDERGNLLTSTGPDGAKTSIEHGIHDLPERAVDPLGGEWRWTRDAQGRVIERADPVGRITKYHYQGPWLVGATDPAGGHTALGYDPHGNVDAVATPDGATTRYQHDHWGQVLAVVDPKGNVQRRTLDALGRVTHVQEPDGNVRALAYDGEGNVVHAKDQHHDVRFSYQGMNRLSARSEAGTTVRFEYDTEEQLTGIANEHGLVYRFVLGPTGEVDEEHGFDGLMRKYTRDKGGRVMRVDRPGGRFSSYKYDPAGRVVEVKHSDESVERYGYRGDGELISAANAGASLLFERDALGRIVQEKSGPHWVKSEYDLLGLRTRMQSSLGAEQLIARNRMGDVLQVSEQKSAYQASFTRDQLGLELERSLPGGIKSRWQRDNVGRPTQHTVNTDARHGSESKVLRAVGYKWESNDRLRMLLDGLKGPTEFAHDALGNLALARYADGSFDLRMPDAVGNLFRTEDRKDREYGPAGQVLSARSERGITRYAYDPEGNLIQKVEPDGRVWSYAWNGAGMLASVTRPDGSLVSFDYDALGRRVKKTYRGQTTHWVWDGNNPLHEWVEGKLKPARDPNEPAFLWSADSLIKKREAELEAHLAQGPPARGSKDAPITWLFEPESFAPMAKLAGGESYSIVTDHLGTPVLMADAAGEKVWSAGISAYGELRDLEGERYACPFRWPGQYEDAETGLYYNRFRYYDAEAGQYASQDPIGLAGGSRLYGYVSDTQSWTDPLGLSGCDASTRKKARQLREGKDVTVSSFKEADSVLNEAFPNARKVKGAGKKSPQKVSKQKKQFKRTPADDRAQRAVYHKDYQYSDQRAGVLAGHEDLPDGHPHKTTPHINVLTPEGDKAVIYVAR